MSSFNPFGGDRREPETKSLEVTRFALWSDDKREWIVRHDGTVYLWASLTDAVRSLQGTPAWQAEGFRVVKVVSSLMEPM